MKARDRQIRVCVGNTECNFVESDVPQFYVSIGELAYKNKPREIIMPLTLEQLKDLKEAIERTIWAFELEVI